MISRWFVHTVTVETFLGAGAYGDLFSAPTPVTGFLSGSVKLVRSATGDEVTSSSSFYTSLANASLFTTDSRVTDAGGRVSRVITQSANDSGGLMPNVEHTAVHLT